MEYDIFKEAGMYNYSRIAPNKRFKKLFRRLDIYALPITLRYKGQKKFYTNFGAATSVCLLVAMLGVLSYYIIGMLSYTNVTQEQVSKLASSRDLTGNLVQYENKAFLFGFQMYDHQGNVFDDPSILQAKVFTTTQHYNDENEPHLHELELPLIKCLEIASNLTGVVLDVQDLERSNLTNYLCPSLLPTNFVSGRQTSETFITTSLRISQCMQENNPKDNDGNEVTCQDEKSIEEYLTKNKIKLGFFYLQSQFDGTNITHPLFGYLDTQLEDGILVQGYLKRIISLQRNEGYRYDNVFYTKQTINDPLEFYQVDGQTQSVFYARSDGVNLEYIFQESQLYAQYSRKVQNVADVLSEVGGLYNSMFLIGLVFTMSFSYNLMLSSLIRSMYSFNAKFDEELIKNKKKKQKEKKKKDNKNGNNNDGSDGDGELNRDSGDRSSLRSSKKKQQRDISQIAIGNGQSSLINPDSGDEHDDSINQINYSSNERDRAYSSRTSEQMQKNYAQEESDRKSGKLAFRQAMKAGLVKERKANFNHKTMGIIRSLICLYALRSRESLRKNKATRNQLYFNKGLEKLDTELDMGYIVRQVRILRYFLKTVLDKDQRVLLKLKTQTFIPSDENEHKPSIWQFKKKFNKNLMMEKYVDNLQRKELTKQDYRLLDVLGFKDVLELLKQREKQKKLEQNRDLNDNPHDRDSTISVNIRRQTSVGLHLNKFGKRPTKYDSSGIIAKTQGENWEQLALRKLQQVKSNKQFSKIEEEAGLSSDYDGSSDEGDGGETRSYHDKTLKKTGSVPDYRKAEPLLSKSRSKTSAQMMQQTSSQKEMRQYSSNDQFPQSTIQPSASNSQLFEKNLRGQSYKQFLNEKQLMEEQLINKESEKTNSDNKQRTTRFFK